MLHSACASFIPCAIHAFVIFLSVCHAKPSPSTAAADSPAATVSTPSSLQSHASPSATSLSFHSALTTGACPSASINYLTHRLPQQCWTGSSSAYSSASTGDASYTSSGASVTPQDTAQVLQVSDSIPLTTPSTIVSESATEGTAAGPSVSTLQPSESFSTSTIQADASGTADPDADPLLDNSKFLSFEEWKKQQLEKGILPVDPQGENRGSERAGQPKRRGGNTNAELDALGEEDSEIVFDFSNFGAPAKHKEGRSRDGAEASQAVDAQNEAASPAAAPRVRSKDAGKTCKERSNFASLDCAASVLKHNSQIKSASSILVENKDSYLLNECGADNKFIIIELCAHIQIDTIVLANFEFFSSMFRTFRVSISDRYPVKIDKWKELGTFEAKNNREIQAFLVENPIMAARYLRIEFLSHYGSEYYCPVSLLRVHGITEMDEVRQILRPPEEADDDEDTAQAVGSQQQDTAPTISTLSLPPLPAATPSDAELEQGPEANIATPQQEATSSPTVSSPPSSHSSSSVATSTPKFSMTPSNRTVPERLEGAEPDQCIETPVTSLPALQQTADAAQTGSSTESHISKNAAHQSDSTSKPQPKQATKAIEPGAESNGKEVVAEPSNGTATSPSAANAPNGSASQPSTAHTVVATPIPATGRSIQATNRPPTQESFFKSIHQRLKALELNTTLSLQYIESQSALLREAFEKVEKRQITKTAAFLETLNATVAAELAKFKNDYDQLWQSTVMEMATQREEGRRERELLGERVKVLAEEMVSQKRLMAAQATLLLLCLGLVLFSKSGGQVPSIDTRLLQGMQEIVAKAREVKTRERQQKKMDGWAWDSPWSSPPRRATPGLVGVSSAESTRLDGATRLEEYSDAQDSPEVTPFRHRQNGIKNEHQDPQLDGRPLSSGLLELKPLESLSLSESGAGQATMSAPTTPLGD